MDKNEYPLDAIHGFTYNVKAEKKLFENILKADIVTGKQIGRAHV